MSVVKNTRQEVEKLKQKISDLRFTADDRRLTDIVEQEGIPAITGSNSYNPKPMRILRGHHGKIYSVSWGKDNFHFASASQDSKAIVWNGLTMNKYSAMILRTAWVMTIDYTRVGSIVGCGGLDNNVTIYALNENDFEAHIESELKGHVGYVSCCRFLDNDRKMLTSSGDTHCMLWDVERSSTLFVFEGHKNDVMGLDVSPNQNVFVSGGCDSLAKLWDIRQQHCALTFASHTSDINTLKFLPNGFGFFTGSQDGSCMLSDVRAWKTIGVYTKQPPVEVTSVSCSVSGRFLFAGYDDYVAMMWDTLRERSIVTLSGHLRRVSSLAVSPDGTALCTAGSDCQLMVWA
eukprot:c4711_g1_i1.p1 GENE.c4711_g1_i1~~c4711_g1_i1.p1  ORF type:complete len:346 (+),score=65.68 c4711_g1_i1:47-1084(+)